MFYGKTIATPYYYFKEQLSHEHMEKIITLQQYFHKEEKILYWYKDCPNVDWSVINIKLV